MERARFARCVLEGEVAVVKASEIQKRLEDKELLSEEEERAREVVVASYGVMQDADGAVVAFVRAHDRWNAKRGEAVPVTEHFRRVQEEGEDEDADVNASSSDCPVGWDARSSDERLEAMHLLQSNVGSWSVSQWCCPNRYESTSWSPPEGAKAVLHYKHGTGVAPLAVLDWKGEASLLVYFQARGGGVGRVGELSFPMCRLLPSNVVEAFEEEGRRNFRFTNRDCPLATCASCIQRSEEEFERERRRGRKGVRGKFVPLTRVCLTPDDEVRAVGCKLVSEEMGTVGFLSSLSHVPEGWVPAVAILRPDPYEVPVRLTWSPQK